MFLRKGKVTHADTNLCILGEKPTKRWAEGWVPASGGLLVEGDSLLSWARLSEGWLYLFFFLIIGTKISLPNHIGSEWNAVSMRYSVGLAVVKATNVTRCRTDPTDNLVTESHQLPRTLRLTRRSSRSVVCSKTVFKVFVPAGLCLRTRICAALESKGPRLWTGILHFHPQEMRKCKITPHWANNKTNIFHSLKWESSTLPLIRLQKCQALGVAHSMTWWSCHPNLLLLYLRKAAPAETWLLFT